jgi:hypothetical protein
MHDVIIRYIEDEQALGRIDPAAKPRSVTSLLVGACFQWVFVQHSTGSALWTDQPGQNFVEDLVDTLWRGLSPRAG